VGSTRKRPRWSPVALIVMSSALTILSPAKGTTCGYHDDVSLARGVLNWVYPDALHVVGAISTAVAERRFSAGRSARGGPALLVGYHGIVQALDKYARQLGMSSGETPRPVFSLLLIEPMLWTRFLSDGSKVRTKVHVTGPEAEDLVVISGEEVIRAIADNTLTVSEAYRLGLIRLYGTKEQVASFLTLHGQIERRPTTPLNEAMGLEVSGVRVHR